MTRNFAKQPNEFVFVYRIDPTSKHFQGQTHTVPLDRPQDLRRSHNRRQIGGAEFALVFACRSATACTCRVSTDTAELSPPFRRQPRSNCSTPACGIVALRETAAILAGSAVGWHPTACGQENRTAR